MNAHPIKVQTRSAPLQENKETARVGWVADHATGEDVLGRKAGHVVAVEDRKPIITEWDGMVDWANCPPTYDVWADQYYTYTRSMLMRWGARLDEVEDMMQEIMARFIERDSLGVFTPEWGSKSKTGRSNFRSYYSRFLLTYFNGKKRNLVRHYKKNIHILDAPVSEDGSITWGDQNAEACDDAAFEQLEFEQLIEQLRVRVSDDALVDAVLMMVENGPIRQKALGAQLGGDSGVGAAGLQRVREALTELLGED